tara:strand:+ start:161 stop:340 length:180 start_codon:yes stop_codon:yes gene_type:complete
MGNEFFKNWSKRVFNQMSKSSPEIKKEELNLDLILDKISENGMGSLTPEELLFLDSQSN